MFNLTYVCVHTCTRTRAIDDIIHMASENWRDGAGARGDGTSECKILKVISKMIDHFFSNTQQS